jgi:pilus assembly protein Flp/PilA
VLKTLELMKRLAEDEDGAALLEYTVLIGILLVAVTGTITLVGGWINGRWTSLNRALPVRQSGFPMPLEMRADISSGVVRQVR